MNNDITNLKYVEVPVVVLLDEAEAKVEPEHSNIFFGFVVHKGELKINWRDICKLQFLLFLSAILLILLLV